jgi:SpoVK/Ycf46/Vps4 family AAA+-type ATPase
MGATPGAMGGINQMLELFKMQYLMRLFQDGGQGGSRGSILMFAVLMLYDQFVRYVPFLLNLLTNYAYQRLYPKKQTEPHLLMKSTPPPASKSVRAYIQFERNPEKSIADLRIDAVVHHVCNLPDVRSLRYNGVEMIPNFKDSIMIENDVWFEIQNPNASGSSIFSSTNGGGAAPKQEPIIYRLSTYDHDITWLHKFVEQAIDRFEQEKRNKLGSETYYFDQLPPSNGTYTAPGANTFCMFSKSKFLSNRSLDNVYLRQIDELKRRVHFFMRRRDWYDSKGIPHTLGVVMYGHPGCGKTSTIKAMANETHRHIFNIMLSSIKTKDALKDLFYNDTVHVTQDGKHELLNIPLKNRLYVIEDIDAMDSVVLKRSGDAQKEEQERKARMDAEMELLKQQHGEFAARKMFDGRKDDDTNKLDLATLLNVLDGVRETPGRIIILSTNYPERLDEALLRPGRFDMMLEFEKHNCAVLQSHLEKHYDTMLTPEQIKKAATPSLNFKWTPAEVSQILFRRIDDVDGALDDLLNEDPKKLFKFSQMGGSSQPAADDLKQAAPAAAQQIQPIAVNQEQQSTNIEDLIQLQMATGLPEAKKKTDDASDDDTNSTASKDSLNTSQNILVQPQDKQVMNGTITVTASDNTGVQWVAHNKDSSDMSNLETVQQKLLAVQKKMTALHAGYSLAFFANPPENVSENQQRDIDLMKQYNAEHKELNQEYRQVEVALMLQSPMFQDNSGFTAMNDLGLGTITDGSDHSVGAGGALPGLGAANSSAETQVDDFFPEPLVPFDAASLGVSI